MEGRPTRYVKNRRAPESRGAPRCRRSQRKQCDDGGRLPKVYRHVLRWIAVQRMQRSLQRPTQGKRKSRIWLKLRALPVGMDWECCRLMVSSAASEGNNSERSETIESLVRCSVRQLVKPRYGTVRSCTLHVLPKRRAKARSRMHQYLSCPPRRRDSAGWRPRLRQPALGKFLTFDRQLPPYGREKVALVLRRIG